MALLAVRDLKVELATEEGVFRPVDGVSLAVERGQAVGLVGESGCGKSVTALALVGLQPGRIVGGAVEFDGCDLTRASATELRRVRGGRVGLVFQEPLAALNPVLRVGTQVGEVLRTHLGAPRGVARARAAELLREMGLPSPEAQLAAYPHQLSGGMRQRVMLAVALAGGPSLLVADEPTTALDPTVQAQVLALLEELRLRRGLALLFISHDLAVVGQVCSRVLVLYAGQVVEEGPTSTLLGAPRHPYTAALLAALPDPAAPRRRLAELPGVVPDLRHLSAGCRFAPRCSRAADRCSAEAPLLEEPNPGYRVRCFYPLDEAREGPP
ncbi:MAG: ABC transporter ATP-binding protein [Deltaproteobacteria bacterium]|nr:ABC transporter ATP-binding protein [Deltaproteobacteria bacterium]